MISSLALVLQSFLPESAMFIEICFIVKALFRFRVDNGENRCTRGDFIRRSGGRPAKGPHDVAERHRVALIWPRPKIM